MLQTTVRWTTALRGGMAQPDKINALEKSYKQTRRKKAGFSRDPAFFICILIVAALLARTLNKLNSSALSHKKGVCIITLYQK